MRKNVSIVLGGHKDHGKSTLVGRLLYDTGNVSESRLAKLKELAKKDGREGFEFAYLTDATEEERLRGITIKLGHKKLLTEEYSFTFADAPGHKDFIDQMEKGAVHAEAVLLLIDAHEGIQPQTVEHLKLCHDKGVPKVLIVVNKMDLIGYSKEKYDLLEISIVNMLLEVGYGRVPVIPCSALLGDNVVKKSDKMSWYSGITILSMLETFFKDKKALGISELIVESMNIIREATQRFKNPVMLWAGGKDSTTMLTLARMVFEGEGKDVKLPFKVVLLDTGYKFTETYAYIEKYFKLWNLDFIKHKNEEAIREGVGPDTPNRFVCCNRLKTDNLTMLLKKYKFDAVFTGIRWDEHGVRGKETHFSERKEPVPHWRVHPMLNWSEDEIWDFLLGYKIPYNPLYDRVEHDNLIIRSIGCYPCTKPVPSDIKEERASRSIDKEENYMEKLRALGYM